MTHPFDSESIDAAWKAKDIYNRKGPVEAVLEAAWASLVDREIVQTGEWIGNQWPGKGTVIAIIHLPTQKDE